MKKILFITPSRDEQALVEEVAGTHEGGARFEMQTTASFGQEAAWWAQNPCDLLVLKLPDDEAMQNFFFNKLKNDVPKSLPLILLAPSVSQSLLQVTAHFQMARTVKMPATGFFLYRTIIDLTTNWEPGKRQAHPRYATEQAIMISDTDHPDKTSAVMRNLSVGGAYFETMDALTVFKPNDMVKIEIQIPGANNYTFDAKIVWAKIKEGGRIVGYGCTFVDINAMYEHLLKGFGGR